MAFVAALLQGLLRPIRTASIAGTASRALPPISMAGKRERSDSVAASASKEEGAAAAGPEAPQTPKTPTPSKKSKRKSLKEADEHSVETR